MVEHERHCPKLPWMIDFYSTDDGRVPNYQLKAAYAGTFLKHNIHLNVESRTPRKHLTSIACTVGQTSSCTREVLHSMMEAGMSVALIKVALYTTQEWMDLIKLLREAEGLHSLKIGRLYPLTIAIEIKGSEIRTGMLKHSNEIHEIELEKGNLTVLTTDPAYEEHVTEDMIYVDYQKITEIVIPGDSVYLDNKINLSALEIVGSMIRCIIETAGKLANHASVSIPSVPIELPLISEKDEEDIKICIHENVDAIILPGMRVEDNVMKYRELLDQNGKSIMVISKIDNTCAVANVDEIIKASDGIMIDRDVLSLEMPQEKLFLSQKSIIAKCNKVGKPVICGPNMLETMATENRPSRAEISDVANTILDGVDCLELCKETLTGINPVDAIRTLTSICKEAEASVYQKQLFNDLSCKTISPVEMIYSLAIATVETSLKCSAAAIICITTSGKSAKIISRFRPRCPIVAITSCSQVARQLHLYKAVDPIIYFKRKVKNWKADVEKRVQLGITYGKYTGFIRAGDAIVVVAGSRPSAGFTNVLKVVYASNYDAIPDDDIF